MNPEKPSLSSRTYALAWGFILIALGMWGIYLLRYKTVIKTLLHHFLRIG